MSTAWQALRGHAERVVRRVWQAQDHRALILDLLVNVQPIRDHRLVFVETGCGESTLALAEVAAVQGCPENTVKTRLFHAKRQLRRCLERRLGSEGDR